MRKPCNDSASEIEAILGVESDRHVAAAGRSCLTADSEAVLFSFVLENDPAQIPGVLAQLLGAAERLRPSTMARSSRIGLALHEAMLNGIHHGNLELDSSLRLGDERTYHRLAQERRRSRAIDGDGFTSRPVTTLKRPSSSSATMVAVSTPPGFPTRPTPPASSDPAGVACS